jgi:translocator protein
MKKKLSYFILFLLLNFGALALGSILMGGSPMENTWYQNLPKAPWTPPGYVFGLAWSSIMICFSLFMARLMTTNNWKLYLQIYVLQWFLNVTWNPFFFQFHLLVAALIVITSLLLVLIWMGLACHKRNKSSWNLLLLPYILWLFVAISLNAYPVFQ